ncbi:MAG: hypothetical protein MHMPM18_002909 [Marteilia pararefringens]
MQVPKPTNCGNIFENNEKLANELSMIINALPKSNFDCSEFLSKSFDDVISVLSNRFKSIEEVLTWNLFNTPVEYERQISSFSNKSKRPSKSDIYKFFMSYDELLPEVKELFFRLSTNNQFLDIFHYILSLLRNKEVQEKVSLSLILKMFSNITKISKTILATMNMIGFDVLRNVHQVMAILYYAAKLKTKNKFVKYSRSHFLMCIDELEFLMLEKTNGYLKSVPNLIKSNKDQIHSDSSVQQFVIDTVKLLEEFSKYNLQTFYAINNNKPNHGASEEECLANLNDFISNISHCLLQNILNKINNSNDSQVCKYIFLFNNIIYMKNTINSFDLFTSHKITLQNLVNIDEQIDSVFSKYDEIWADLRNSITHSANLIKKDSTKIKTIICVILMVVFIKFGLCDLGLFFKARGY